MRSPVKLETQATWVRFQQCPNVIYLLEKRNNLVLRGFAFSIQIKNPSHVIDRQT